MICSVAALPLIRAYRLLFVETATKTAAASMARMKGGRDMGRGRHPDLRNGDAHASVSDPALKIFPYLLDHPEMFEGLLSQTGGLKAAFKKSQSSALRLFRKAVLSFWPAFCDHRSVGTALEVSSHDQRKLQRMRHDSVANIAQEITGDAAVGSSGTTKKSPEKTQHLFAVRSQGSGRKQNILYTPFHVSEVLSDLPGKANAMSELMHMY